MGLDVLQPPSSSSGGVAITGPLAAGDARPAGEPLEVALYGWNGATWDRLRSSIANGLVVDVSRVQGTVAVTSTQTAGSDTLVNTGGLLETSRIHVFDSVAGTWARTRAAIAGGGNLGVATGLLAAVPYGANNSGTWTPVGAGDSDATSLNGPNLVWNTASWDRQREPNTDTLAVTGIPAAGLMGWNGASWDRLRASIANGLAVDVTRVQGTVGVTQATSPWVVSSTQTTPADALANTAGLPVVGQLEVWNGATWDRAREATGDALAVTGLQASGLMGWNGASWDRLRTGADNADALAGSATGILRTIAAGFLWNATGGNWSRARDGNIGDGASAVGVAASGQYVFNATTWDRARGDTTQGTQVGLKRTTLIAEAKSAANAGVTATLAAAGAGLFHYITAIEITRSSTAALAGAATFDYTSTNLPGAWRLTVGNGMAAGDTKKDFAHEYVHPLKSSVANTATTIVAPAAGAAVLTQIMVTYYTGP